MSNEINALVITDTIREKARALGEELVRAQKGKKLSGSELRTAVRLSIMEQDGLMPEIVRGAGSV